MFTSVTESPLGLTAVLGMLIGIVSMMVYRVTSPQERIAEVSAGVRESRLLLSRVDDSDIRVVWALSKRALGLSLQQLLLMIAPTALAVTPTFTAAWGVDRLFDLSGHSLGNFGPTWLTSGHTAFWVPLCLAALAVKLRFNIK